jgi:hypothetical protein
MEKERGAGCVCGALQENRVMRAWRGRDLTLPFSLKSLLFFFFFLLVVLEFQLRAVLDRQALYCLSQVSSS